jgi:hypothetical protein
MAIIVKEYSPEQKRSSLPEQPKIYQFFEIEVMPDEKGILRNMPIEKDRKTLQELESQKTTLEVNLADINKKIDLIHSLK